MRASQTAGDGPPGDVSPAPAEAQRAPASDARREREDAPPTRPVLRWHGGKWRLAPWIISHFPRHRVYVEPFGGGGSVLLRKPRAHTEILNDREVEIVNLFRVIRERPDELARALALTPYARDEYAALYVAADDPLERARAFVARSFMGQSSKGGLRASGFDTRVNDDAFISRMRSLDVLPDEVAAIAGRLTHVTIKNDDALALIARHDRPDCLFYCDPPYLDETHGTRGVYRHRVDHAELLALLQRLSGMVVLSGYPSALYDDALAGWMRVEKAALADGARPRTEVLWINPACAERVEAERRRAEMPLFAGAEAAE